MSYFILAFFENHFLLSLKLSAVVIYFLCAVDSSDNAVFNVNFLLLLSSILFSNFFQFFFQLIFYCDFSQWWLVWSFSLFQDITLLFNAIMFSYVKLRHLQGGNHNINGFWVQLDAGSVSTAAAAITAAAPAAAPAISTAAPAAAAAITAAAGPTVWWATGGRSTVWAAHFGTVDHHNENHTGGQEEYRGPSHAMTGILTSIPTLWYSRVEQSENCKWKWFFVSARQNRRKSKKN